MDPQAAFYEETIYSEEVVRRETFKYLLILNVYENTPLREDFYMLQR